jgi:sugar phosphate isomerase/epimerase
MHDALIPARLYGRVSRRAFRPEAHARHHCAQLYTLRNVLPEKPLETLKELERIGYREVECTFATLDAIWPALQQTSLKPVSVHLDTAMFTRQQAGLQPAIDDARKRGFQYALCPYIDPQDRGGVDVIKKLAVTLNKVGEQCRAAGLGFAYHNHAFEFEPAGGKTLLDVLLENTDPKLVGFEFDIMWSAVAGVDPVQVLKEHGARIPLVHLKNLKPGLPKQYKEGVAASAFREVGNGAIDIPAVLKAAATHVKHYFVEQDQTPGPPIESLRKSFDYLQKL